MTKWFLIIITALGVVIVLLSMKLDKMQDKYEIAVANIKAYDEQLSTAEESNAAFQLTVDQLESFQERT